MSLQIKPLAAILDQNYDQIGKSVPSILIKDPYVVLILGNENQKSSVCKQGGKKPLWKDTFTFHSNESLLYVQIWDKDTFSKDDLIGKGVHDIKKVFSTPNQPITELINLAIDGKHVGQIQIAFLYSGPDGKCAGNQQNNNLGRPNEGNENKFTNSNKVEQGQQGKQGLGFGG